MSTFKAKIDDRWQAYTPEADHLLKQAFSAGFPSVRFTVHGTMYKFDFKRMQQKNLTTGDEHEILKPLWLENPEKRLISKLGPRPVFVVKVPAGSSGTKIQVPHPKQLGKFMPVLVPSDAKAGEHMFVPIPSDWKKRVKYTTAGVSGGSTVTALITGAGGLAGGHAIAAGGVAAGGGLLATAGPVVLGGVAVAAAITAGAVAVQAASKHPRKAVLVGAAAVGGLALADHIGEHGVIETAGALADGAGDLVEGVADLAEAGVDAGDDFIDAAEDVGDAAGDIGVFFTDVIADLF